MRNIIGLVVGLYLTVALVVFAAAAWSFNTDTRWKNVTCATPGNLRVNTAAGETALAGGPDWLPWAAYRAIAWPKTYMDDQDKVSDPVDWLMVQYNPFPQICGR
jgi:hypothetical protein